MQRNINLRFTFRTLYEITYLYTANTYQVCNKHNNSAVQKLKKEHTTMANNSNAIQVANAKTSIKSSER